MIKHTYLAYGNANSTAAAYPVTLTDEDSRCPGVPIIKHRASDKIITCEDAYKEADKHGTHFVLEDSQYKPIIGDAADLFTKWLDLYGEFKLLNGLN